MVQMIENKILKKEVSMNSSRSHIESITILPQNTKFDTISILFTLSSTVPLPHPKPHTDAAFGFLRIS